MKNLILRLFSLMLVSSMATAVFAQCPTPPTPDFSYCYDSNETDVVAFEICPTGGTVVAAIALGDYEANFDDLTVYSGAAGSNTGGTIVFGPADGDLTGSIITASSASDCLIFVSNTDGSVSCQSGSRPNLEVYRDALPPAPVYDFTACYGNNESDAVVLEICGTASQTIDAGICVGNWEANFDDLTVYEGGAGSGTGGTIVFGPADGDLAGTTFSSLTAGNCLIFVSNSDGSVSCQSGSRDDLAVNADFVGGGGGGAAVPTMGQWGLFLFSLVSLTLGMVFMYRMETEKAVAGMSMSASTSNSLPFNMEVFQASIKHALGLAVVGFAIILVGWGEIVSMDLVGMMISIPVVAYMIHIAKMMKK